MAQTSTKSFHPELIEDYIDIIDAIYEVRLPPLLYILKQYKSMEEREREGKAFIVDSYEMLGVKGLFDDFGNLDPESLLT